jgi:hypothetical protein
MDTQLFQTRGGPCSEIKCDFIAYSHNSTSAIAIPVSFSLFTPQSSSGAAEEARLTLGHSARQRSGADRTENIMADMQI